tara:strand:- start:1744 stop:1947 length:204 start_codon:yes stop_codon:yes gene_type:complete
MPLLRMLQCKFGNRLKLAAPILADIARDLFKDPRSTELATMENKERIDSKSPLDYRKLNYLIRAILL